MDEAKRSQILAVKLRYSKDQPSKLLPREQDALVYEILRLKKANPDPAHALKPYLQRMGPQKAYESVRHIQRYCLLDKDSQTELLTYVFNFKWP